MEGRRFAWAELAETTWPVLGVAMGFVGMDQMVNSGRGTIPGPARSGTARPLPGPLLGARKCRGRHCTSSRAAPVHPYFSLPPTLSPIASSALCDHDSLGSSDPLHAQPTVRVRNAVLPSAAQPELPCFVRCLSARRSHLISARLAPANLGQGSPPAPRTNCGARRALAVAFEPASDSRL